MTKIWKFIAKYQEHFFPTSYWSEEVFIFIYQLRRHLKNLDQSLADLVSGSSFFGKFTIVIPILYDTQRS